MRLNFSYILALVIFVGVAFWMYSGSIVVNGQVDESNALPPPAERLGENDSELFKVKVETVSSTPRQRLLELNGRVEASAKIVVRSETAGKLIERSVSKGTQVAKGAVICVIDPGIREARLVEAETLLEFAESEYTSTTALKTKGFSTENRVSNLKANLDSAKARVDEAKQELERTEIKAPVSGTIELPVAEVGSLLGVGDSCATILTTDPMLAVGQISEREIERINVGMDASITTISDDEIAGKVSYLSQSADPNTRTFRVEVELPNPTGKLREGISALIKIPLSPVSVHKIKSSTLTLNDNGQIGVQTVNGQNMVEFFPVEISGGESDGIWVSGLPNSTSIITVGQEYVIQGQIVEPIE